MKQSTNKQINEYIENGNAFEVSENVYLEQTTQYRKKFTLLVNKSRNLKRFILL